MGNPTSGSTRAELNAYLKGSGVQLHGDLCCFEPATSETKEVCRPEHVIILTISTHARQVSLLDPKGIRLDRFRKNPIVLYGHDYNGLPVGRGLWERIRPNGKHLELVAKMQFHLQTELSREVWALVVKDALSAWSIGFIPDRWERGTDGQGFRVTRWDVLEYSCVPRPEDFAALRHELKERRITAPSLVKSLAQD